MTSPAAQATAGTSDNRGDSGREIRLMDFAACAGWAGKLSPATLADILGGLPKSDSPNLLVGTGTFDDAGVYRISDDLALVQTVDVFPPIVNDPAAYGRIAAANSLSDVYAMGGRPLTAMNVLGYPRVAIPPDVIGAILGGAMEKTIEAGAVLCGGHTMEQKEVFFGLSITGTVAPDAVITNADSRVGDALILTKPVGTGILATALKNDKLGKPEYEAMVAAMERLNKHAAEAIEGHDVSAMTDVTGFGIMGHAREMADGGGKVSLRLRALSFPLLPGTEHFGQDGMLSGGLKRNRSFLEDAVRIASDVSEAVAAALFDPQTSGGLLIAVAPDQADAALAAIHAGGDTDAVFVGEVVDRMDANVSVDLV